MHSWKWNLTGALMRVPIFYKVVVANSAMAGIVIATLLLLHDDVLAVGTVVVGCGIVNTLLVRAAFSVDHLRAQQREVLAWTISESERERGRVAAEIHDGAAQRLAVLMLRAPGDHRVSTEAAAVIQELCDTASTLQPPGMGLLGLEGALKWYARSLKQRHGMDVEMAVDCPANATAPATALGVYRLVEDALAAAAMAGAEHAGVFVRCSATHLALSVRVPYRYTGSELFRLTERVALLNGSLHTTPDDADTVMRITIPIREHHV